MLHHRQLPPLVQGSLAVTTPFESSSPTLVLASTQPRLARRRVQAELLAVGLRQRGWRCVMLARCDGALAERMAAAGFEVGTSGGGRGPGGLWNMGQGRGARQALEALYYNDSHAITGGGHRIAGAALRDVSIFARAKMGLSPSRRRTFARRGPCASPPGALTLQSARRGPTAGFATGDRRLQRGGRGLPRRRLDRRDAAGGPRRRSAWPGPLRRPATGEAVVGARRGPSAAVDRGANATDHKGHRFLLDAMPAVLREMPNVTLALAGDGELLDPLRQQAQRWASCRTSAFSAIAPTCPT